MKRLGAPHSDMRRAVWRYLREVKDATTPRAADFKEHKLLWDFRDEEILRKWSCISDEDVGGLSKAKFKPNGKGA